MVKRQKAKKIKVPKVPKYATVAQINQVSKKIDKLHKIMEKQAVRSSKPKTKRKPSEYNKFAKKMLAKGHSFSDVGKAWKARSS
jgi:SOS response regulatory protein OraA/RecX